MVRVDRSTKREGISTTELYVWVTGFGNSFGGDDQFLPCINLIINFRVEQTYHSSEGGRTIEGITREVIGEISSRYPYHSITYDLISTIIAGMNIPFPLEKMREEGAELEMIDDLITHVLDEAHYTVNRFSGSGQKIFRLDVYIENRVILPRHEIEAMNRAKEIEQRASQLYQNVSRMIQMDPGLDFPRIHREIGRMLDNKYEEDLELSLLERAMRDYFQALETMRFVGDNIDDDDDDDKEEQLICAICMNEVFIGSQVTRMPCSHRYHVVCIAEWLKRSHMCPLCRFKLSVT